VREVVRDVSKEGASRLKALNDLQRVSHGGVRGMWMMAERVEEEKIEAFELRERALGNGAEVCEIRAGTEAIAENLGFPVNDSYGNEGRAEEFDGCGDVVKLDLGESAEFVIGFEDVLEDRTQGASGALVGVERKLASSGDAGKAERTEIVEAENVVSMAVGVEDGVDAIDPLANGLFAEVGRCVDENAAHGRVLVERGIMPFDHDGRTKAPVMWIGRMTNGAVAPNGRNAHGGAASQNRERSVHLIPAPGGGGMEPGCGPRAMALVTSI
jgi:hypothetical protein